MFDSESDAVLPFDLNKANEISGDKRFMVRLKSGVELHMLNAFSSKRKLSGPEEDHKIKVSDYVPEGDLNHSLS